MTENLLRDETSPYLLQHRDNPVHWRPWGEAALAEAESARKPILLSVGYAACHWCHVMAHESFEDPAIAAVMNDLFVCIKVDREERPDVDAIYQQSLALLGQQGGWPLTMFLTPAGEPFWGGTYFPPQSRWGRPGFADVLRTMAEAWRTDPDKVQANVKAIRDALDKATASKAGDATLTVPLIDRIARRLVRETDPFHGGIGEAPKFPSVPVFLLLWRAWKRTGLEPFRRAVLTTLTQMSQGGIWDHLGGGFARYSVDERWLVPHFEKMLYDNAQMLELLTTVWQDERDPLLEARIRETAAWLLREMRAGAADDGSAGFAASVDADSEGEEGRFYVWTEAEIDALLGPESASFKSIYDVTATGNWKGRTILNRLERPDLLSNAEETRLAAARETLLRARAKRPAPERDDKVLADWNGLTIAALARAAVALDEPPWLDAARDAFAFVARHMVDGDGRLRHSWRDGRLRHPATLDDHAQMARAALTLFEIVGDRRYLDHARNWAEAAERHFADPAGGYFMSADDADGLIVRPKSTADNATPGGSGTMAEVEARLWLLTGEMAWAERAGRTIASVSGEIERNFYPLATLINAAELLESGLQIVIAGADGADAMLRTVWSLSLPNAVVTLSDDRAPLPANHPAAGKGAVGGRATAYVCEGPVCSLPLTEPDALRADLLRRYRGSPQRAA
ncbi:uncharacterized protein YyaL (SSP411 family) [Constrictibacter sp. MBR-5]|jgi:uncharacterized protein YyaL (SSP411 family)|uniref:thioredoxin domain-containing protein n=1 Tax=Constrictibacter sp. MBR-5 TaxID=3156467 RepID=UPI003390C811